MARNCTHKVGFPSVATSPYGFKGNMQSCSREGRDSLIPFWILWTLGCVEGFSSFAYLMYSLQREAAVDGHLSALFLLGKPPLMV